MLSTSLCIAVIIYALHSHQTAALSETSKSNFHPSLDLIDVDVDDEPCDESFPLAPTSLSLQPATEKTPFVAIPNDPTRRSYAPLCSDGRHINIRSLQKCNGNSCFVSSYNSCLHITSWECRDKLPEVMVTSKPVTTSSPVTSKPTPRPTVATNESVHAVKLTVKNVPSGYRPSAEVRSLILRFVSEILEENLDNSLELIKVEHSRRLKEVKRNGRNDGNNGDRRKTRSSSNLRQRRRLEAVSFPLSVTVSGPADVSDFALSYVLETIRDHFDELVAKLRKYGESMDPNVFANVELSAGTYSFDDDPPSYAPTSKAPTTSPTIKVVEKVTNDSTDEALVMDETGIVVVWWVWLMIVLLVLLFCICCVLSCIYYRKNVGKEQKKHEKSVSIWMNDESVAADSRRPMRSQRQPRMNAPRYDSRRERRSSKHQSRPIAKRYISHTELEEEVHKRVDEVLALAVRADEAQEHRRDYRAQPIPVREGALVEYAEAVDPPEELGLVPYTGGWQHSKGSESYVSGEPEGLKAPRKVSLFASDVYYISQASHSVNENRAEDPGGARSSKHKSRLALGVDPISAAVSDANGHEPRRVKPSETDSMLLYSFDNLPEEVQAKSRVNAEGDDGEVSGRKKKKKPRKKDKRSNQSTQSHDIYSQSASGSRSIKTIPYDTRMAPLELHSHNEQYSNRGEKEDFQSNRKDREYEDRSIGFEDM